MEIIEIETPELDIIIKPQWFKIINYSIGQKKEIRNLLEHNVWVTAYRKKIFVKDMTTNHIKNCINCFNGVGNMTIPDGYLGGKDKWLKIFNNELISRN